MKSCPARRACLHRTLWAIVLSAASASAGASSEKRPLDLTIEPLAEPTPDFTERLGFRGDGLGMALPEAQAFGYEAIADGPSAVLVRFVIAPGYYLYRDQMAFEARFDGQPVAVAPGLPAAEDFEDPHFGWSSIYRTEALIRVELQQRPQPAGELRLLARFQGCKQDGICYPPMEREIAIALAALVPLVNREPVAAEPAAGRPMLLWLALGLVVGACMGAGRLRLNWRARVGLAIGVLVLLAALGELATANAARAATISAVGLMAVAVLLRIAGAVAQPALAFLGLACLGCLAGAPGPALLIAIGALVGGLLDRTWPLPVTDSAGILTLVLGLAGLVASAAALPVWLTLVVGGAWLIDSSLRLGALKSGTPTALRTLAVLALLAGQLALIGAATGARDWRFPLAPPTAAAVASAVAPGPVTAPPIMRAVVRDTDALDRALEQAHGERALIIHGTARWCADCDAHRQALAAALPRQLKVGWIEIDLSANDAASRLLLARLRELGPPFYVVHDRRGRRLDLRLDPAAGPLELAAQIAPALSSDQP